DCGANQTCWPTNKTNTPVSGTGHTISNCVFSNFEPTSLSSPAPSSGSAWQLPANGGESVICIPEGPINGQTGPQGGTVAAGGACTQNSDCVSNTCAGDSPKFDQLCKTGEANCQCKAVFTW